MSKCYVFVKVEHAEDQLTCRTQIFVLKCQQTYLVVIQVKKNIYIYISFISNYFWRKFIILEMQNLNTYIISLNEAFQTIYITF